MPGRVQWKPVSSESREGNVMNSIIYIVGLVVIIVFVLGFFGLR